MEEQEKCQCPLIDGCKLIRDNKDRMPELVYRIKENNCHGDSSQCARKWLADRLGLEKVPALMMPNQLEWARQVYEDHIANLVEEDNSTSKKFS